MKTPSQARDNVKKHVTSILFPVLYTLVLIAFATIIYFYANGYRFDFSKQQITQTGVVDVESSVSGSDVYINEKLIGKTPKSTSLNVGSYNITVKRAGYYDWNKAINITEGKSVILDVWSVKQSPDFTTIWTSQGEVEKTWENDNKDHIIFLTKDNDSSFSLWEYSINPPIWDFSDNPSKILQLSDDNFSFILSPNGLSAFVTISTEKGNTQYVIDTQKLNILSSITPVNIDQTKNYKPTWSKDNNYIILETDTQIAAYNIRQNTTEVLVNKTTPALVWTTDTSGFIYVLETTNTTTTQANVYRLKQIGLDGSTSKYIIDTFYFNNTEQYINQYRTNGFSYNEFTTSPESTMSAGKISSLEINQEAQGIFITTNLATYWFDMSTQKFMMISAYPGELIAYNNEPDKLIFQDQNYISIFIFKKTEGDSSTSIGSRIIQNISDPSKILAIGWIPDLDYIYYIENNSIYTADKDGENKSHISDTTDLLAIVSKISNKSFYTFTKDSEGKLSITDINVH